MNYSEEIKEKGESKNSNLKKIDDFHQSKPLTWCICLATINLHTYSQKLDVFETLVNTVNSKSEIFDASILTDIEQFRQKQPKFGIKVRNWFEYLSSSNLISKDFEEVQKWKEEEFNSIASKFGKALREQLASNIFKQIESTGSEGTSKFLFGAMSLKSLKQKQKESNPLEKLKNEYNKYKANEARLLQIMNNATNKGKEEKLKQCALDLKIQIQDFLDNLKDKHDFSIFGMLANLHSRRYSERW